MIHGWEVQGDPEALAELHRRLESWHPDQVGTLLFLHSNGRVLLIEKRRGHGAGRINGPGGKPEAGESPLACVLRETWEEVGVRVMDARLAGVFRFLDQESSDWLGFVFLAEQFDGEPRETEEAIPAWYPDDALPFQRMWEDDRHWLPRLLAGGRLEGDFLFHDGSLRAHRLRSLPAGEPFAAGDGSRAENDT